MQALLAGIAASLAAFLTDGAFAADPYPDQRNLPAAELKAATEAMRARAGADAGLPLVASGTRGGNAYAVFAAPAERAAPILSTQRRVLCTGSGAQWSCEPQVFYRFTQGRLVQSFAYQAKGVREDPAIAFKIVGYFGQCVGPQYAGKIGRPLPGGMPAVAEVVQEATRITVTANAGNTFELAEAKPGPGQTCAYTLQSARVAEVAAVAPAASSPELPATSGAAPTATAGAAPVSGWRHLVDRIAGVAIGMNLIAAALALGVPIYARRKRGRRAAAMNAALTAAAAVAFAILVVVLLKLAGTPDAGHRLRFVIPATLAALASALVWGIIGALAARAAQRPKKAAA
jgi:hypothetical protein